MAFIFCQPPGSQLLLLHFHLSPWRGRSPSRCRSVFVYLHRFASCLSLILEFGTCAPPQSPSTVVQFFIISSSWSPTNIWLSTSHTALWLRSSSIFGNQGPHRVWPLPLASQLFSFFFFRPLSGECHSDLPFGQFLNPESLRLYKIILYGESN